MWKQPVCSQPEWHRGWNGEWKIWGRCCIMTWAGNSHFEGLTQATKAKRRWEISLAPVSFTSLFCPCASAPAEAGPPPQSHHPLPRVQGAFNLKQQLQLMVRHSQKLWGHRKRGWYSWSQRWCICVSRSTSSPRTDAQLTDSRRAALLLRLLWIFWDWLNSECKCSQQFPCKQPAVKKMWSTASQVCFPESKIAQMRCCPSPTPKLGQSKHGWEDRRRRPEAKTV